MEISYRRTPPNLLERAFTRLLRRRALAVSDVVRLDVVHEDDLNIMWS